MADAETYLKGAAAAVAFLLGILVLAGGPRRTPNRFLAAFFLLIAGNQAVETYRAAAGTLGDPFTFRIAALFAVLDPLVLYYFASIYPERNALNQPRRVWSMMALAALLALWAVFVPLDEVYGLHLGSFTGALNLYTASAYSIILLQVLRTMETAQHRGAAGLLFPAMCFAAIPVWSRLMVQAYQTFTRQTGLPGPEDSPGDVYTWAAAVILPTVLASVLVVRRARALPLGAAQLARVNISVWAAVVLVLFLNAISLHRIATLLSGAPEVSELLVLDSAAAAIRWVLFGSFVSMAVLRHDMLGTPLQVRRRSARVVVAVSFVGIAYLFVSFISLGTGQDPFRLGPIELALLGAALVASQGFQNVTDKVAARVYGVPPRGDPGRALEAYRLGVEQAINDGRDPSNDRDLDRLRRDLGLSVSSGHVIERMAQSSWAGPLTASRLVGGRYRIERLLARGGGGRSFLARDELLERDVVIKEIELANSDSEERALREARTAGSLQHPNVVTVLDVIPRGESSLLVTEYLPGGTLETVVQARRRLAEEETQRVLVGILVGLEAVHARGIVHRDLKPANIFLDEAGNAKIGDFGLARLISAPATRMRYGPVVEGTFGYIAPEVAGGADPTPAADLYAVGRLGLAIAGPEPRGRLGAVLAKAVAQAPRERWASAAEMRGALLATDPNRADAERHPRAGKPGGSGPRR